MQEMRRIGRGNCGGTTEGKPLVMYPPTKRCFTHTLLQPHALPKNWLIIISLNAYFLQNSCLIYHCSNIIDHYYCQLLSTNLWLTWCVITWPNECMYYFMQTVKERNCEDCNVYIGLAIPFDKLLSKEDMDLELQRIWGVWLFVLLCNFFFSLCNCFFRLTWHSWNVGSTSVRELG